MRLTSLILLPLISSSIVNAADQIPLKDKAAGWFDKAKAYIPSNVPVNPIDAGAAKVAAAKVERINIRNWQRKLAPKLEGQEEWLVYLTGGNKSCYGRCGEVDLKWNESVPLLSALPQKAGAPTLHLGYIDCDADEVLCTAWAAPVPAVYHFMFPQQVEPQPKSPLRVVNLNMTTTQVSDIVSIPSSSKSRYLEYDEYHGALHPIDGWARKLGLLMPFGYAMWGFGSTPSWMVMIGISFVSRQIMSRRMSGRGSLGAGDIEPPKDPMVQARQAAAAPASPKSGGSKKKR